MMRCPISICLLACGALAAMDAPPVLEVPAAALPPAVSAEPAEAVWGQAAIIPALVPALDGDINGLQSTEVRVLWGPKTLFVRFISRDDELWNPHTERDAQIHLGDECHAYIQLDAAGAAYAEYQVGPVGQVFDAMFVLAGTPTLMPSGRMTNEARTTLLWKFVPWEWKGNRQASRVASDGRWIVDIAFDMREYLTRNRIDQLQPGREIRANFVRHDWPKPAAGERVMVPQYWSAVERGCPHLSPARMGTLRLGPPR